MAEADDCGRWHQCSSAAGNCKWIGHQSCCQYWWGGSDDGLAKSIWFFVPTMINNDQNSCTTFIVESYIRCKGGKFYKTDSSVLIPKQPPDKLTRSDKCYSNSITVTICIRITKIEYHCGFNYLVTLLLMIYRRGAAVNGTRFFECNLHFLWHWYTSIIRDCG